MDTTAPAGGGVYAITNVLNGKQYIGSAVNLAKRWREHQWALAHDCHHSAHLQHAVDRYGIDSFTFSVLEYVSDLSTLLAREQEYLDQQVARTGALGYNICPIAGNTRGVVRHKAWRQSISDAKKGKTKGQPWSEARRAAQPRRGGETLTDAQRAGYASRRARPRTKRELAADEAKRSAPMTEERMASIRKASAAAHAKPHTEKQRATSRLNLEKARAVPLTQAQLDALARGRAIGAGHEWTEDERLAAKIRPRPPATERQRAALEQGRETINRLGLNRTFGPRKKRANTTQPPLFDDIP